jgi:hypothetical protein
MPTQANDFLTLKFRDASGKIANTVKIPVLADKVSTGIALEFLKQEEKNRPRYTIPQDPAFIQPEQRTRQQEAAFLGFICAQLGRIGECAPKWFEQSNPADLKQIYNSVIEMLSGVLLEATPTKVVVLSDGCGYYIPDENQQENLSGVTVGQVKGLADLENMLENRSLFDFKLYALANILKSTRKGYEPEKFTQRAEMLKKISFAKFMGLSFFLISRLGDYGSDTLLYSVAVRIAEIERQIQANLMIARSVE